MTEAISAQPLIELHREEILSLPDDPNQLVILATGPLTSPALSDSLKKIAGADHFYFYDAISPIVDAQSLNREIIFAANRYGKQTRSLDDSGLTPDADYLNCPFDKIQNVSFFFLGDFALRDVFKRLTEHVTHFAVIRKAAK